MTVWKKLFRSPQAIVSAAVILCIIILGVLAPLIAPHDPTQAQIALKYAGPSAEYPLGNDYLGRCTWSRLLYGVYPSVLVIMVSVAIVVGVGMILGVVSGYYRGWVDEILMRICDVMLAFPTEIMILAFVGVFGMGLMPMLLAIVLLRWPWYAVMIRNATLKYVDMNYIYFSKASGMRGISIILRHVIPMTLPDVLLLATSNVSSTILMLSGFSFLGLGIQPPQAEWGTMLSEAKEVLISHPTQMLPPGIAIMIVCIAFSLLGDAIRDAMDAKHDRRRLFFRRRRLR